MMCGCFRAASPGAAAAAGAGVATVAEAGGASTFTAAELEWEREAAEEVVAAGEAAGDGGVVGDLRGEADGGDAKSSKMSPPKGPSTT